MTESEKALLGKLLKRLSRGDKTAYNEIYERFYKVIYCFVQTILHNPKDSEDATQNTFLELLKPDFNIRIFKNPTAYLFEIAKNKAIDCRRKNNKYELYDELTRIIDVKSIEEKRFTLEELFEGLTKWEEELILLRYDAGYKVFEIAKKVGVSKRTLNRAYRDIKETLRENLKELSK